MRGGGGGRAEEDRDSGREEWEESEDFWMGGVWRCG